MALKKAVNIVGWVVCLVCLAFFIRHISQVGLSIPDHAIGSTVAIVVGGAVVYATGVYILALAWWQMLKSETGQGAARPLIASYLVGQFAKYLPGNVFQYAARHGLSAAAGASHGPLVAAALAEIYLLLCCGAAVALAAAAPILAETAPGLSNTSRWLALVPLGATLAISIPGRVMQRIRWVPRMPVGTIAVVCSCYIAFFLTFGALYFLCLIWANGGAANLVTTTGAAAMAWIAGFVVPGPPAGAGVREVTLTLGAGAHFHSATVATSILMFRILTLCGDLIAFLGGSLILRSSPALNR